MRIQTGVADVVIAGGVESMSRAEHERAVAVQKNGLFDDESVPVEVAGRKGKTSAVDTDKHPRPDTSLEALCQLTPVRHRIDEEAIVTAGNSSGQNDGAAACIVTSPEIATELGLRPLARLVSLAVLNNTGWGSVPSRHRQLRSSVDRSHSATWT